MANARILVVDDEPDLLELIELTLSRMGFDTRPAADLRQARALLMAEPFDLCLTDMRLPDGDGLALVQWIQEHRPETRQRLLLASSHDSTSLSMASW